MLNLSSRCTAYLTLHSHSPRKWNFRLRSRTANPEHMLELHLIDAVYLSEVQNMQLQICTLCFRSVTDDIEPSLFTILNLREWRQSHVLAIKLQFRQAACGEVDM